MSDTTANANLTSPIISQPDAPGQIVGMVLQNTGTAATAANTEVTFGQAFLAGAVQPGQQLYATINGTEIPVQMDAKTFNADGSVSDAVLTFAAPSIAANSSANIMLSVGPALAAQPAAIDLAAALKNYSLTVDLAIQTGTTSAPATTNYHIDAVAAMEAALANGTASYWQQGPNATQARVTVPVTKAMQMVFDITANANGTFTTDVQFLNDEGYVQNVGGQPLNTNGQVVASDPSGGVETYSETITQNGQVVSNNSNIQQGMYQNWHTVVTTQPSVNQINVQHDIAYLEKTGLIQNYDLAAGIQDSNYYGNTSTGPTDEAAALATTPSTTSSGVGAPFGSPLAANGVDTGMGGTGGRPDIGPTTGYNAAWLVTQSATAEKYALAQADASGSVPWNIENGATGQPLTTAGDPSLWTDGRGGPYSWSSGLIWDSAGNSQGWSTDLAHQPALSYDAALLTGSRYYVDQAENQGAFVVTNAWPSNQMRNVAGYSDIVVYNNQVRGSAWDLRDVINAANLAPAGSAEKAYFTKVENDNFSFLISQEATLTAQQGQAYGYIEGGWGNGGGIPPWEQDYLYGTIAQAALQGNTQAQQVAGWMDNFIVGRFLQSANGFDPNNGVAYSLIAYNPANDGGNPLNATYYKTWAQIEAATAAAGISNGTGWQQSQGDFGQLGLQSLADSISIDNMPGSGLSESTQVAQAYQAYGWLISAGDPYINLSDQTSGDLQFNIVPRLADGNLLAASNLLLSKDAAGSSNTLSLGNNNDQLIHAGAGNDMLVGGNGIDLLFGGSGSDILIGGSNNDFLYGGSGSTMMYAGPGTNYLQSGTGATTFVLSAADVASDTISGFRTGTDSLEIIGTSGEVLGAVSIASLLSGATADASGNAVLHLSGYHQITLLGITLADLSSAMFQTNILPSGMSIAQSTAPENVSLTVSGQSVLGGAGVLNVSDTVGQNTIAAGGGGMTLNATGTGDFIVTQTNTASSISVSGSSSVTSAGNDSVALGGSGNMVSLDGSGALLSIGAGSSSNSILAAGTGQILSDAGTGNIVTVSGANSTILSAAAQDTIEAAGTGNSISLNGSGQSISLAGDANAVSIFGTNSAMTLSGSQNAVSLGDSQSQINVSGSQNSINSGTAGSISVYGSGNHLNLAQSGPTFMLGSNNILTTSGKGAIILSGSGNLVENSGLGIVFGSGTGNTVNASGSALLVMGGGNVSNSVSLAGGAAILANGGDSISASGSNLLVMSEGDNQVSLDQQSVVFNNGGANTITAVTSGVVFGGAGSLLFQGGSGGVSFIHPGQGSVTAIGGAGGINASGGSNGGNLLEGGGGSATLFGGGDGDSLVAGAGSVNALFAGGGNETLNASAATGSVTLSGSGGLGTPASSVMLGGSGGNLFIAGTGMETMTGGSNATLNTFVFGPASGGTDLINGFRQGTDRIELLGGVSVQSSTAFSAGVTVFNLTDGTRISVSSTTPLTQSQSGNMASLG